MIKFKGELTGNAKKCFIKKNAWAEQITLLLVLAFTFPTSIAIAVHTATVVKTTVLTLCLIHIIFLILTFTLPYLPVNIKDKLSYMPKEIYLNKQHIVCVGNKHTESKLIEKVKVVYDCGDYYDIRFPFGHYSSMFVCQKNLLVKGSLERFEKIFEGKIIRKL